MIVSSSYDCIVISETKLDDSFSTEQFSIPGYKTPYHADRDAHGGGLLVYIKQSIKSKRTESFEENGIENIVFESNLRKVKWAIIATYNPPSASNENF